MVASSGEMTLNNPVVSDNKSLFLLYHIKELPLAILGGYGRDSKILLN
jgi:hypothetical protein